jgi:hypothetical protein
VLEFISLDGAIKPQARGKSQRGPVRVDKVTSRRVSLAVVQKRMNMPFDLLLGRITFDMWARFWPEHNDIWPRVNTAIKHVASNTMTSHKWQPSVFLNGDIPEKISKLKQQEGPNLYDTGGIQGDGKRSHLERHHHRELRARRRSPNRKLINTRPREIWGIQAASQIPILIKYRTIPSPGSSNW